MGREVTFADNRMKEAYDEFVQANFYNGGVYAGIRRRTGIMASLSDALSSVSLSEMTVDTIENMLASVAPETGASNGSLRAMSRFILHLCKTGRMRTDYAQKILPFEQRLMESKTNARTDIPHILRQRELPAFMRREEAFQHEQWYNAFFFQIRDLPFADAELQHEAEDYTCTLKEQDLALDSIYTQLVNIKQVLNRIYGSQTDQIDMDWLIDQSASLKSGKLCRSLLLFVLTMTENGKIEDDGLTALLQLRPYIDTKDNFNISDICKDGRIPSHYHMFWAEKDAVRLVYINVESQEIREALQDFAESEQYITDRFFYEHFGDSLTSSVEAIEDLNYTTFNEQLSYYLDHNKESVPRLVAFYNHVASNYNASIFEADGLSTQLLQKGGLGRLLIQGYKIIKYNPLEPVPHDDKWILCFPREIATNMDMTYGLQQLFAFDEITNETYRLWTKSYVWQTNGSFSGKSRTASALGTFFNYVDDIKSGRRLTLFAKKNTDLSIRNEELQAYRNEVHGSTQNSSMRNHLIYDVRKALLWMDEASLTEVPIGVEVYLRNTTDTSKNDADPIPVEDLTSIAKYMQERSEDGVYERVMSLIFYLGVETNFRLSNICGLAVDCVQETTKRDEYVVVSKTKNSRSQEAKQAITIYTKQQIDELIDLTREYREECHTEELRKSLLLLPARHKKGSYYVVTPDAFNSYLKKCCRDIGVKEYTYSNLRDTYMTRVEEYRIRKSLSDMQKSVLTGHVITDSDRYYTQTDIRTMLEAVHGVIIGDVDVAGKVVPEVEDEIRNAEHEVSHSCGYCERNSCNDHSTLGCLMCESFVTMVNRLPYFTEWIKQIDKQIEDADIPHDKESYVNIKRLILGYMERLVELRQEEGYRGDISNQCKSGTCI